MAPNPTAAQVLGRVVLLTGKAELLSARTVATVRDAVRKHDPEAEFSECEASDLTLATLGELSAPSLFSSTRCVVVTKLEGLPDEAVDGLVAYAGSPAEDVSVVLVHSGVQKGTGIITRLTKLSKDGPGTVTVIKSEELKARDLPKFVSAEVASHGSRISEEAVDELLRAVGSDLRSLAAAAEQLVFDFPGEPIDLNKVKQYYGGRAEARSFDVADAAFAGQRARALEELRWAMDGGVPAVLVTSAMAGSARAIAKLMGAPRGARDGDLARDLGVPPFKVKIIRGQSRRWNEETISTALRAVATADSDIKGRASDASYTLERLVLTVSGLAGGAQY